jgi:hypothetical protein
MTPSDDNRTSEDAASAEAERERIARLKGIAALQEAWQERAEQKRNDWLLRPRLHTARIEEKKRKVGELAKQLGWSNERLALFTKLVVEYRQQHSIEAYLRVRREFPEVEIQVGHFGGIDALFSLEEEFKRQGLDPRLIAAALDSNEPAIDALSLRLLELLVARDKLPKDGPGHIEQRRNAISDGVVNYLITMMLEGYDWHDEEMFRVPASLVVLIRHQLCGPNPDLHATYLSREKRKSMAFAIGHLKPGEELSVRKLARMAGIPPPTAARWLKDESFRSGLKLGTLLATHGNPVSALREDPSP